MEKHTDFSNENMDQVIQDTEARSRRGKIMTGVLIVAVGSLLMAKQMGAFIPGWVLSWKTLLIGIGLLIGAKNNFKSGPWLFPILIGGIFLIEDFVPGTPIKHFMWPIIIISFGLWTIFKPKKREWKSATWGKNYQADPLYGSVEDRLEATTVFGGIKKNIVTKTFKGGEVTCAFGGAEINLSQADFTGVISLECTQIFGGAKFLIPAHWKVQSEITTIFGSMEDNRPTTAVSPDQSKILILKGVCLFGGIEIVSY